MNKMLSIGCVTSTGMVLEADYRFDEPMFRHRIRLLDPQGQTIADWDAVLGGDHEDWPASPPVQEISRERIGDRDCLLGVGRAGKSHWSISVETLPPLDATDPTAALASDTSVSVKPFPLGSGLRFDIACRCPKAPGWLGSTYRTDAAGRITLAPGEHCKTAWCGTRMLRIEPREMPTQWPGTVRWRYTLIAE